MLILFSNDPYRPKGLLQCIFDTFRNEKIYAYGSLGNGPGEFLQPMITYAHENTFGLNDINTQTLAVMSLNDSKDGVVVKELSRNRVPYKRKKGELNPADYNFVKLDDKHFVSLLCGKDGSFFSLLDSNLQPLQRFGNSPIEENCLCSRHE